MPRIVPKQLFHYTSADSITSILRANGEVVLYATHIDYLNDHQELHTGLDLIRDILEDSPDELGTDRVVIDYLKTYFSPESYMSQSRDFYVTCFSEARGTVDQWRGYGASGCGFAIGFKENDLLVFSENNRYITFNKCLYNYDDQITALLKASRDRAALHTGTNSNLKKEWSKTEADSFRGYDIAGALHLEALRIKHSAYSQEREWRLVVDKRKRAIQILDDPTTLRHVNFRASKRGLIPYIELEMPTATSALVGPHENQTANANAITLLASERNHKSLNYDSITSEEIPFRE